MTAILDTSFLFALTDTSDRNHGRVVQVVQACTEKLILPVPVLPEICYLITSRLGHRAMRQFIEGLRDQALQIESLIPEDFERIHTLLVQYVDSELDFTDTTLVAIAERLGVERIYTLDRRDFSIIRPKHCDYFELLPYL